MPEGTTCIAVWHKSGVSLRMKNAFIPMTIEETLRFALNAHEGQKDLVGNPAVLHLLAVCVAGKNELEQKAGLLHDIVEDTDVTLEDLRSEGVEEEVVEAVDLLTHREEDSYEEYVRKIAFSRNETAIRVKLHDLHHNLQRAEDAILTIDPSGQNTKALYDLIVDIAVMHQKAEAFIQDAILRRS